MAHKESKPKKENKTAEVGRDPIGLVDKEMSKLKNPATVLDDALAGKKKGKRN